MILYVGPFITLTGIPVRSEPRVLMRPMGLPCFRRNDNDNDDVRYMSQFEVRYMSQFEVRYMSQAQETEERMMPPAIARPKHTPFLKIT